MKKRLTKSKESRVFAGIMGGLAEYFDLDPVLMRVLYVFATAFTGFVPGIIGYIVAALIVPAAPEPIGEHSSAS